MKKEWNRDEWQGRSQKQVESNHSIATLVVGLFAALLLALVIKIMADI
jgi:type IV secretory pathway component VirB8